MTETQEHTLLKSSRKRRMAAILIDHFVMTFLIVSAIFLSPVINFMDENNILKIIVMMIFAVFFGLFLYFAKDSVSGISVGKWIMGIMVRDGKDYNLIPSFGRLLLRNLFLIIWPVEFIVMATSDDKKRLGDRTAETVVLKNPRKPKKIIRILTLFVIGIMIIVLMFVSIGNTMKNSQSYKIAIQEIEKNEEILLETGGIIGYGMFPMGSVKISNGQGQALLHIKVLGNIKDIEVSVYLEKEHNGKWEAIEMEK